MAACGRPLSNCHQINRSLLTKTLVIVCLLGIYGYFFFGVRQRSPKTSTTNNNKHDIHERLTENKSREITRIKSESDLFENVDIVLPFVNVLENRDLQKKFQVCVESILRLSSVFVTFHILSDSDSFKVARKILNDVKSRIISQKKNYDIFRIIHYDVEILVKKGSDVIEVMQARFASQKAHSYYGKALFFLSIILHKVFPETIDKVIMLDVDLKFQSDIRELSEYFGEFNDGNIMGIALEMQPVYRHTFQMYRDKHPGTLVGEPPTHGNPGLNSGVLLLDLTKIRASVLYNIYLNNKDLDKLLQKFEFKGHLGDQDFFSILSMEHPDLFFILPCNWNVQLCKWWKGKGYDSVFDHYHNCSIKPVKIYHGNCGTTIPE